MTTTTIPAPTTTRMAWVDQLRGLAIALMVLDHVLVLVDPGNVLRFTPTRLALPLFMVTAAVCFRRLTLSRLAHLAPAIIVELLAGNAVLGTSPGIVTTYALVAFVISRGWLSWLPRRPALLVMLGVLQTLYMPVPWSGYQPGLVLAWLALGFLAGHQFSDLTSPRLRRLQIVGRHPIAWYCGHLLVLGTIHHLANGSL